LIAWSPKATRRGVTSRLRVFLPCEIEGEDPTEDIETKKEVPE